MHSQLQIRVISRGLGLRANSHVLPFPIEAKGSYKEVHPSVPDFTNTHSHSASFTAKLFYLKSLASRV